MFPTLVWADLDEAVSAYNSDDFDRVIALAEATLGSEPSPDDTMLARELIALSEYYKGRRGTGFLAEMQALEAALEEFYGRNGIGRLDILYAISDVQFSLGQIDAATETDVQIARVALASPEGYEDAIWTLRNIAIAFEDGDPREARYYAALFEFYATQIRGLADPLTVEATGMMARALFRDRQEARAAQRFLQYSLEDWEEFATIGPDEEALVAMLFEDFTGMDTPDEEAWLAMIDAERARVFEADTRFSEAWELLESGVSPLEPDFLELFDGYLALASPEDPLAAIYATTVMRNYLDIGDFDRARPYLSLILSYPVPFIAILDLPIGYSAVMLAMQGGVEEELFEALVKKALDVELMVRSDNPELLLDLLLSRGEMHIRLGQTEAALGSYRAAIDLAGRGVPGQNNSLGLALHGAAMALTDLGRDKEALDALTNFRAFGENAGDTEAVVSAIGSMAWIAQRNGDEELALALSRERLTIEQNRAVPDPAAVQLALFNLATLMLDQSDKISADLIEVLTAALSGPAHADLAHKTRASLLRVVADRLDATPETIATHAAFRRVDAAQRAGLVTLLGESAMDRGDTLAAKGWVDFGAGLAAEGSDEALRLLDVSGRVFLAEGDATNAVRVFRILSDRRLRPAVRTKERATDHVPYHLAAAFALSREPETGADLRFDDEMFRVAQKSNTTTAGDALNMALARRGADSAVADLLRKRDLVAREITQVDSAISRARYDGKSPGRMLARQEELVAEHTALSDEIAERAPNLSRVAGDRPMRIDEVAAMLRDDEVLVQFVTSDAELAGGTAASFLVALSNQTISVAQIPGRTALAGLANDLRCSAALTDPNCAEVGVAATRGSFSLQLEQESSGPSFDTEAAHLAYQLLIEPIADMLEGRDRLIVVPDQTLLSLPFHLVLQTPHVPGRPLGGANWLIRDMSVEIAPSIRSFVAFRENARDEVLPSRFFGVGDPLIGNQRNGPVPFECHGEGAVVLASAVPSILQRSSGVDRVGLIADMTALPDARCELQEIAARFEDSLVLLHGEATETEVKRLSLTGALRDYSVLSFATHGLVAGEIGVNDSGLVLTPPRLPTAEDDGILTTAEIAGLDLDADFVVLSACNTASGDSQSDEGLSGMASAFFLAGAQSLLVSHWPVYSDAAVALTTGTFDVLRRVPGTSRAEAVRQSMLTILDDPDSGPRELHPAYWGAFMIVGDGLGAASR
ncbi:MAG: CHAT domain-containing protein [Pelagibaca sp.]